MSLELRNPHSVLAALQNRPREVLEVRLQSSVPQGAWEAVVQLARRNDVRVTLGVNPRQSRRRSRKESEEKTGRAGIAGAIVQRHSGTTLEHLFADATSRPAGWGLWLALDCLQDPHNVGAIFRTASFFGVAGIVLTRDRSAPLNETVYDISCGGIEHVPFVVQANLSRALGQAKKAGLWVLGTSEHAQQDISLVERDRPWLLVLGNEEKGLRRLTLEKCDNVARLVPHGLTESLNVSVAAGVLMSKLTELA